MAKSSDDQTRSKPGKARTAATWVVTGMLVAGLTGFGAANFGNTVSSIGSVGTIDLTVRDYVQAVREEAAKFSEQMGTQLSGQQAISIGLDRSALSGLVTRSALDNAAFEAGLSVGNDTVGQTIMKQRSFIGSSGSFDQAVYRDTLSRSGIRENDYENGVRRDVSRSLLTGAISGGFVAPGATTDALYKWIGERRGFSLDISTTQDDVDLAAGVADAGIWYGDGQWAGLQADLLFEATIDLYARPGFATGSRRERLKQVARANLFDSFVKQNFQAA